MKRALIAECGGGRAFTATNNLRSAGRHRTSSVRIPNQSPLPPIHRAAFSSCSTKVTFALGMGVRRSFSSGVIIGADPVLDTQVLQESIMDLAPVMAQGLNEKGFWTITGGAILPMEIVQLIRAQAVELRKQGRYEQSWSERVVGGVFKERFDKEGVFACEPDGQDYDTAPDMIVYMSVLLQTLPICLNQAMVAMAPQQSGPGLSNTSFNAKLAVTLPGGSTYPLHVDNPQGLEANDTRKLTCILYLNPSYDAARGDGGELRLVVPKEGGDGQCEPTEDVDLTPEGGRMVLFWSDEIPHEVLPTAPSFAGVTSHHGDEIVDNPLDRYALTLWIPTEDVSTIHNEASKFRALRDLAFPPG